MKNIPKIQYMDVFSIFQGRLNRAVEDILVHLFFSLDQISHVCLVFLSSKRVKGNETETMKLLTAY